MELVIPAFFIVIGLIVALFVLQMAGRIIASILDALDKDALGYGCGLLVAVIIVAVVLFVIQNNS